MSEELKKKFFFCPKYGKAERCPMVKASPSDAKLVKVMSGFIDSVLEDVSIEYMDNMTEGKMTAAIEALAEHKEI